MVDSINGVILSVSQYYPLLKQHQTRLDAETRRLLLLIAVISAIAANMILEVTHF
jgi:hypothetical protein